MHTSVSRNVWASQCSVLCREHETVLVLKLWKGENPNIGGSTGTVQTAKAASKHLPEHSEGTSNSINVWRAGSIDLPPWSELLLSLFNAFQTDSPAGIQDRPSKALWGDCDVPSEWPSNKKCLQGSGKLAMTLVLMHTVIHSALSADFTSPGALAFVLGVDLAPGLQEQYSETTEFNLAEWFLMFLIGSGRPGKKFDASTFTVGFSFTAWREQDWNFMNCQYWLKKNWNAFSPSLICIGHFIQKNRENCHKSRAASFCFTSKGSKWRFPSVPVSKHYRFMESWLQAHLQCCFANNVS